MPSTESQVYRAQDPIERSDPIKAFQDTDGSFIQAMALVDENGNQTGLSGTPLNVTITGDLSTMIGSSANPMHVALTGDTVTVNNASSATELTISTKGYSDPLNQNTANLTADETYTGTWVDTLDYATIIISIRSDQNSATDGLKIEWSHDASEADQDDKFTISANIGKVFTFAPADRYYRISYTNGGTITTKCHIHSYLKKTMAKGSSHRITDSIVGEDDAELVKAVLTALKPNGDFTNVDATAGGNLKVSIEESDASAELNVNIIDDQNNQMGLSSSPLEVNVRSINGPLETAFGRLRTANPYTLADIVNRYNLDTIETWTTGAVTNAAVVHFPNKAAITLSASTESGSSANLTTLRNFRYQAGKGGLVEQTLALSNTAEANCIRRWGYFDEGDGCYWTLSGTTFGVVRRSSAPDGVLRETFVAQSAFNLDTLDGNGPSTYNIDLTKTQIFWMNFQWLGVGTYTFGIVNLDGDFVACHQFQNSNTLSEVYMRTANLPLNYNIENRDGIISATAGIDAICATVVSEGGDDPPIEVHAATNDEFFSTGDNNEMPLLSIRSKTSFNGVRNKVEVVPQVLSVAAESRPAIFTIRKNATLTGATWTNVSPNSTVEFDITASANPFVPNSLSGQVLAKFLVENGKSENIDLEKIFGTRKEVINYDNSDSQGVLTITIKRTGAVNADGLATIVWGESK